MASEDQTGLQHRHGYTAEKDGYEEHDGGYEEQDGYTAEKDGYEEQDGYVDGVAQDQAYPVEPNYGSKYVGDYRNEYVEERRRRGVLLACCLALCWCVTWPCHGPCCGGL